NVAREGSDCRSVPGDKVFPLHVEFLSAPAGGDSDHHCDVRGDGLAVHAVLESRADYFDLGAESRRAWRTCTHDGRRGRRETRALENAAVSAIYGLYSDPDAAQ